MSNATQLTIDGKVVTPEDAVTHCTFRFVVDASGKLAPVLYTDGKRETRLWHLRVQHEEPRDPHGRSG